MPGFPDQERTPERPRTRTGKWPRTKTQLGSASLSTRRGQNSSGGGAPTAAAAQINHVQLKHPKHQLLLVQCRDHGRQFLVDGGFGRFLTQIQTDLFIPAVDNTTQRAGHVNEVQIDQQLRKILENFPQVIKVISRGYSKLQRQHGVKHVMETGDSCPARSRAAAEREFRAMEQAGIVSCSSGSTWACTWWRSLASMNGGLAATSAI